LCVLATNSLGRPFFIPAAVYLGGAGQTIVRAIDRDVVDPIGQSELASSEGGNSTSGGVDRWGVDPTTAPQFSTLFRVDLRPPSLSSINPGWRPTTPVQWFSNYTDWFIVTNHSTATNVTIEFASVPGYATPPPFHTNIATGFVTNGVYIVVIPANYTLLSSAQLVVTPGGGLVS